MIYISLTTVPKRLSNWKSIQLNLESLLNQKTNKEYNVIFNIPKLYAMGDNVEYALPDELLNFAKKHPKLIINRDVIDYGPIVKIYGALKFATDPNDIIIALDDDYAYHEDMLEFHIKKLIEYPDHVICFHSDRAAEKFSYIEDGIGKFEIHGSRVDFPLVKDTYVINPGHCGSVSYKRYYFKEDFNEKLFSLADGDDPLMGYYLKKHQICIMMVKWNKPYIPVVIPFSIGNMPIIMPLVFHELSGGWEIRRRNSQTIHGRQDKELEDLLNNKHYKYIIKNNE
jgi:hypothetical protein